MELSIQKRTFLKGLARTHAVADRKSSMPILSNILLAADTNNQLRFAATDLYLGVHATAEANVRKRGSIAVSARTIFDIVKNLPEGEVTLLVAPNHAVEVRCGKVRYKLPGMPGDDFPPLPSAGDATFVDVDAEVLSSLIAKTQYSMSTDDTRPHLAGTLFEAEGDRLRMVTTDGHRLSKAESTLAKASDLKLSMLIPSKGIAELKRLLEEAKADNKSDKKSEGGTVAIASAGAHAFFRRDGLQLSVKLADEQFPPYAKVIPARSEKKVAASRHGLLDALRRISLVASDKSGGVRLAVEPGILRITSENPDVGEGAEEIEVDYAGTPLTIGFNAKYVLDVLSALPDDVVVLELGGELDPGVIKAANSQDFVGVIMPMRI